MKGSEIDISFRPKDHLMIELYNQNLSFIVKLLIGRHKVAKTITNNGVRFTQPHHLEDIHRDGPQSSRANPGA
jgi:hypothetical protein